VKPELTLDSRSPLMAAKMVTMEYSLSPSHIAKKLDMYRCFLDDVDLFDEFDRMNSHEYGPLPLLSADEVQWLWQKSSELVAGDDIRSNQRIMIRSFWANVALTCFHDFDEVQFPFVSMDRDILSDIQNGCCQIFRGVLRICEGSMDSYIVGARFLNWLASLDLDPELCVASEHADLEDLCLSEKRMVFERDWEQKWILGFEWVFDHEAPGYTLVSEYPSLTVESDWPYHSYYSHNWSAKSDWLYEYNWPVAEWEYSSQRAWDKYSARFNRRTASKERKERARLGQKQARSRMPGEWKW
jgi:hypothetical protein